jgi:sugar O-acyltransferase (sialic acid O-acetyltransferase NeuD family)
MPTKPLVIFGAGGFARECLELTRDINLAGTCWDVLGFVDDTESTWGTALNELPVLGGTTWLEQQRFAPWVVLGIGSPATKHKLVKRMRRLVAGFATLVHPSVVSSASVNLGEGVIITAGNILTCNIEIGDFAMLNLMCTVGHDSRIDRYATVSPGANISGNVHIGEGCDVGTGSAIIQGVEIGEWSIVGAGAVVSKALPPNCTAVGVPAQVIKQREAGWHLQR